jgi:hypothetical protein
MTRGRIYKLTAESLTPFVRPISMTFSYVHRSAEPPEHDESSSPTEPTVRPDARAITRTVSHPSAPAGPIAGFRFLWAFYVKGLRADRHCQPCFRGRRVAEFCTPTARSGESVTFDRMDRYPYLYICGVGNGPRAELHRKNLHMPLRLAPGRREVVETYNGYLFTVENAELLPIPELPAGWNGRDLETTRCKNFRFGVAYFGESSGGPIVE